MTIRLLMLVRGPSWFGGVVNFVKSLEANLSNKVEVKEFRVGQRKGAKGKWVQPIVPLYDAVRLAWHLLRYRYDIVHVNPSLNTKSLVRDALFLLVLKLRCFRHVVVFIHGWEDSSALAIENNALLKKIFVVLFGGAPLIYVLATRFSCRLEAWGVDSSRVRVVTTMFDGRQFDGVARNRSDDVVHVLFLSRFVKEKGVYELLEAFAAIHDNYPNMKLIFAGTGPEEKAMHSWVDNAGLSDYVTFTGYIRDKEKAQVLMDADVFVLPSYSEGCPVSLLEAMAAGLPVVISNTGGIPDIIIDGKNGRLLDNVNTAEVEKAMLDLLKNPESRMKMGEHNQKTAWEQYEAAVVSKEIEVMYTSLLRGE